ncbi:MAG: hypothetical protein HN348_19630 [Proteobacteria bacterium]|nr:hypothetical protein [Pseudomonadota bacterium]
MVLKNLFYVTLFAGACTPAWDLEVAVTVEPEVQSAYNEFPAQILVTMEKQYGVDDSDYEPTDPGPFRLAVRCEPTADAFTVYWTQSRVGFATETHVTAWMTSITVDDCEDTARVQRVDDAMSPGADEPLDFAVAFAGIEDQCLDCSGETVELHLKMSGLGL